ncbi:NAD(P)-dependent oxidoreductase [Metabacillus schmidteae]|uniref:NAD(P)-dependent oxidoreductase n=1 Tax=Metabacillus schmidteae TaxID=2730405 RepID=UPI00158F3F7F|nr:SDR family oxidoreductase [Metabacillus schmidteae]
MNIALFGATGRVGKELLSSLLDEGHFVTVLVRSPEKVDRSAPNLTVIAGDATQYEDVLNTINNQDAVISALSTDGQQILSTATPHLIKAMEVNHIKRIITIGTAGILQSRSQPELYRYQSNESKRTLTRAAEEHLVAYQLLKCSSLMWTLVCPTYLPDGTLTKKYRFSPDFLPLNGKEISVQDTAHFAYQVLLNNKFLTKRVGICY